MSPPGIRGHFDKTKRFTVSQQRDSRHRRPSIQSDIPQPKLSIRPLPVRMPMRWCPG